MFAKFYEYNTHSMETRFKTLLDETFNAHSMRTRNKSIQLEELSLSDLDTQFTLPGPKPHCVLVFDTETTGLIQKSLLPLQLNHLDSYPYITQLSAVLYDVDNQKVKRVFNTYVKIPDHIEIPEIVQQLTGINREKCNGGIEIGEALATFQRMYAKCDAIVAHNMSFDSKMICIESMRNKFSKLLGIFYQSPDGEKRNKSIHGWNNSIHRRNKSIHCTMMRGMEFCKLSRFVKLSALYELLFHEDANQFELHNSLVDTMVCLRCYLKIFCNSDISNETFHSMISNSA